jgi:hypothetical protein
MVEQHPLSPVEAATAQQMDDWQRRGERRVQLRTQCMKLGTNQFGCAMVKLLVDEPSI